MSRRVLVVDDEPLVRETTVSMLEDLGCEVLSAADATEALTKLSADRRIEILITDINMPEHARHEWVRPGEGGHADARTIKSDRLVGSGSRWSRLSADSKAVSVARP